MRIRIVSETVEKSRPSRLLVVLAFAAVYLIWGSTYISIRFAIQTIPPFLMAGSRFLIAGSILFGTAAIMGTKLPTRRQWKPAAILGALLLLGGNGGVVWAEQRIPSGLAALLIASEPLWIVVLDWLRPGGVRPGSRVMIGLLAGFAGTSILVGSGSASGSGHVDLIGAAVLLVASLSWASGSLYSRSVRISSSPLMAAGMQMLAGGALLLLLGLFRGEASRLDPGAISLKSVVSVAYLIVFGAVVGFTAYSWLLKVTTPVLASTYAYVNPIVAVLLGWALAGEQVGMRTAIAAGVIVSAVVLITTYRVKPLAQPEGEAAIIAMADGMDLGPDARDGSPDRYSTASGSELVASSVHDSSGAAGGASSVGPVGSREVADCSY
jgi:drug/metabolite transporter (DMT)-like permease